MKGPWRNKISKVDVFYKAKYISCTKDSLPLRGQDFLELGKKNSKGFSKTYWYNINICYIQYPGNGSVQS